MATKLDNCKYIKRVYKKRTKLLKVFNEKYQSVYTIAMMKFVRKTEKAKHVQPGRGLMPKERQDIVQTH